MNNRIDDKICEIEKYLDELEEIKPLNLEDYIKDIKTKAACERYIEKIIEAVVDLAFLLIKYKNFKSPESDTEAFNILSFNKIISLNLSDRLQDAKGMRNIIAHQYGQINDEIVFETIDQELIKDVTEFIEIIKTLS